MDISKLKHEQLNTELNTLKKKLPDIVARKQAAIAEGDLSENTEYEVSLAEYTKSVKRISEIEYLLSMANVVDNSDSDMIHIGDLIEVRDLDNLMEPLKLVLDYSGDPLMLQGGVGILDANSPLGKVVLNGTTSDYTIHTPSGVRRYNVRKVI